MRDAMVEARDRAEQADGVGMLRIGKQLVDRRASHLATIEGMVPNMTDPPPGCRFAARCPFVRDICINAPPPLATLSPGHASRCIRAPLERLVS